MSFSVDTYLSRRYDQDNYTCLHFARDAWLDLTGVDIIERLHSLFVPVEIRRINADHIRGFTELPFPKDPCIVLLQQHGRDPHLGIYYKGRILQLDTPGPSYIPIEIASYGFTRVRYFI